jgi:hypothetical protein
MTLMAVAGSPWWWAITAFALVAIYWAEGHPSRKRLIAACVLAVIVSFGMARNYPRAAEVPDQSWCEIWHLTPANPLWWTIPCWW